MALQGSLRDFGVAEILQLIASQEKTGILTFTKKKESISIGFEAGRIAGAVEERRGQENPLEAYLVASGRVSREQMDQLSVLRTEFGIPFEELIVREGYMSRDGLSELIRFKIQEIIDNLLTWQEGTYKFTPGGTIYPASSIKVSLDAQAMTLEGMRRIDEWPRIERALSGDHHRFARESHPILSLELDAEEQRTLELIDGRTSLEELIDRSGLGRFRTYQAVYNLLEVGAIKKLAAEGPASTIEQTSGELARRLKVVSMAGATLVFLLGLTFLNVLAGPTIRMFLNPPAPSSKETTLLGRLLSDGSGEQPANSRESYMQSRIELALEVYYFTYGTYPAELVDLSGAGLAERESLADFEYRAVEAGSAYTLAHRQGPWTVMQ
ncbi:hypothetical protein AMJ82_05720 [candidate division TA06 bacterium SM23_40]|uniref:PatA-like N-terminal domain-containing protein n=1 Tax=candidate division TA06 bacterium SM23_40 TaxID=1703774 RepID=A0A0S8G8H8_UNCT6|nr:MAG: hypothetical protein AMJ82_05720 [candidate division TA06 bacterium SM23_40]